MLGESDRACPLIGQEWIGDALEEMLYEEFSRNGVSGEVQEKLLKSPMSPLGSFAMKAAFCGAFGLIPQQACHLLDAFRVIRNHCAHGLQVSLSDGKIAKEVQLLRDFITKNVPDVLLQMAKADGITEKLENHTDEHLRLAMGFIVTLRTSELFKGERLVVTYSAAYLTMYIHGCVNHRRSQVPHPNTQPISLQLDDFLSAL